MDNEALDSAILAALPENSQVLSVAQHGSTNWSTGIRVDILDKGAEKSYFLKIIEREELVGMAEAEYEGQKAVASIIPDNAVKPVAWGFFSETTSKAWFMAEYCNLRARAPPLEQLFPIVRQLHQKSSSPTGKFGFHVTPHYGLPSMVVDWTENWEEFWVRELRSTLRFVESMRGKDAELLDIAEQFIQKVATRLLRPLQTGGRNIKPSLCHGDLWDGNIQFNVDTQQPMVFDPCCFYGHHEMDFQSMRAPRYTIGQNFIDLYKVKVGASEPSEDFEDRIALYSIRNELLTAGMWPQWASLIDKVKTEMNILLEKYPDGLDGFKGSLEPTIVRVDEAGSTKIAANDVQYSTHESALDDSGFDLSYKGQEGGPSSEQAVSGATDRVPKPVDSLTYMMPDTPPKSSSSTEHPIKNTDSGNIPDNPSMCPPSETPSGARPPVQDATADGTSSAFPYNYDTEGASQLVAYKSPDADVQVSNGKGVKTDLVAELPEDAAHHLSNAVTSLPNGRADLHSLPAEDAARAIGYVTPSSQDFSSAIALHADSSGQSASLPGDIPSLPDGSLDPTGAAIALPKQMTTREATEDPAAEYIAPSDALDGLISSASYAKCKGNELPPERGSERPRVNEEVAGPDTKQVASEPARPAPQSEIRNITSTNGVTLLEKVRRLFGNLSA